MRSVSYSSRRERSINNPRRKSGDPQDSNPPLSVPEGRSFLKDNINNKNNMRDSMLSKLSVLFFETTLFCFNDNRDNADNRLSATRTELVCRIMILTRIISN